MDNTEISPEVTPQVVPVRQLLKWVSQGILRAARFQRPFVWNRARVVDLFDSIRKQYPIGTLLLWVPHERQPSRDTLGPLRLREPKGGITKLIIDGQQRLTSIVGVLLFDKTNLPDDLDDPGMWELWFDADERRFRHAPTPHTTLPASWIEVPSLINTTKLQDASSKMRARLEREESSEQMSLLSPESRWRTRSSQIEREWQNAAEALANYQLPVVEFHTDDLRMAVESFSRLNRGGQKLSVDQMWSALTKPGGDEANLADLIDTTVREVKDLGYGRLDRMAMFRLILLELGHDPFRTDWNRLAEERKEKTQNRMEATARRCHTALLSALRFLREDMALPSLRLLPYNGLLVALAVYLGYRARVATRGEADLDISAARHLSNDERELLVRLGWRLAFAGFLDGNPSKATAIWRLMRIEAYNATPEFERIPINFDGVNVHLTSPTPENGLETVAPTTAFPSRHDLRAARLRASLWATMSGWRLDEADMRRAAAFINQHGAEAWRSVSSSRRRGAPSVEMRLRQSPANWAFDLWGMSAGLPSQAPLRERLTALDPTNADYEPTLSRLQISPEALAALRRGDDEEFLRLREERMIDEEREFLTTYGITPPKDRTPQPSAIDHPADDSDLPEEEI